jgi:hypothetical protein
MANKGLIVVIEGQRINLRIFRRQLYPISKNHKGKDFIVYSDTKRETEINYNRAKDYELDNPFNRIKLIRLARAMNCIRVNPKNPQEFHITICTNRELYEPNSIKIRYIPFDPKQLEALDVRIKKERKKIEWENRFEN